MVALIAIVAGALLYQTFIKRPRRTRNAAEQMQAGQFQFEQDSFALALTNPGQGYPGFLDIADEYGSTAAGNLANYYIAVSYLNLGTVRSRPRLPWPTSTPTASCCPCHEGGSSAAICTENWNDFGAAID